jgi:Zn-ribbon protein, possibly nucleic acid-binding
MAKKEQSTSKEEKKKTTSKKAEVVEKETASKTKETAKKTTTSRKKKETEVAPKKEKTTTPKVESNTTHSDRDLSMGQKLSNLYKLQSMLSEIDKIKTLRGELPLEVRDLEDDIAGLQTRIQKYNLDSKDLETTIGQQKLKITDANSLIEKYQSQLDNVRNNREFDSLSKEIEYQGLEIELAEKKIKEFSYQLQNMAEEIEKNKEQLEERKIDLKAKKGELDEIISETRIQEEQLREQAKDLETTIEPRLLTAFKRIRKSARNGLAVVYIQRDACGGCFNKIPPQRQLDIKLRKKIIVCEHCGRIMIDPELAGVE